MSHSFHSFKGTLQGIISGSFRRAIKEDTRSLDYSSLGFRLWDVM